MPQVERYWQENPKRLRKLRKERMVNVEKDNFSNLLYWMEVNSAPPYGAISAALLAEGKSSKRERILYHFQHNEKLESARDGLLNLLAEKFPENSIVYGEDSIVFLDGSGRPACVVDIGDGSTYLIVKILGIESIKNEIKDFIESTGRTKKQPLISRIYKSKYGFETVELTLPKMDEPEGFNSFYPYIKESPKELWEQFKNSKANVLLFIGEPGTGKSSFIRAMMDAKGYEDQIHLVDNEIVLLDPELMGYVQSDSKVSLMITEDADRFVAKREDENHAMVGLLNASSGIAGGRVKFIISTNLPNLKSVDPALIRPGRCFKYIEFGKLTPNQANEARSSVGLPSKTFTQSVTLAQALNELNGSETSIQRVGFI